MGRVLCFLPTERDVFLTIDGEQQGCFVKRATIGGAFIVESVFQTIHGTRLETVQHKIDQFCQQTSKRCSQLPRSLPTGTARYIVW
jgi:hypothetical protein